MAARPGAPLLLLVLLGTAMPARMHGQVLPVAPVVVTIPGAGGANEAAAVGATPASVTTIAAPDPGNPDPSALPLRREAPLFMSSWEASAPGSCQELPGLATGRSSYRCAFAAEVPILLGQVYAVGMSVVEGDSWFSARLSLSCVGGNIYMTAVQPDGGTINATWITNHPAASQSVMRLPQARLASQPGRWAVRLEAVSGNPVCSLTGEVTPMAVQLATPDALAVGGLVDACCASPASESVCNILTASVAAGHEPQHDLCHSPLGLCDADGRLTEMILDQTSSGTGLQCSSFPAALSNLTQLEVLSLSNNQMNADLATVTGALAPLAALRQLMLRNSSLSGSLDCPLLEQHPNLTVLAVSSNPGVGGALPGCFVASLHLQQLYVTATRLSALPDAFDAASALRVLFAATNGGLAGSQLPASLGLASSLQALVLTDTSLGGSLWSLPPDLRALLVANASLAGPIPTLPPKLAMADMSRNQLTGSLPATLAAMAPELVSLDVSSNRLGGPLPSTLPANLSALMLADNGFVGGLPRPLPDGLRLLIASHNQLTDSLPEVSPTSQLQWLDVSGNALTGGLPAGLLAARHLRYLNVSSNKLTQLAADGGDARRRRLRLLRATGRALAQQPAGGEGAAAAEAQGEAAWDTPALMTLDASGNSIAGGVPEALGRQAQLRCLNLSHNSLDGTLEAFAGAVQQTGGDVGVSFDVSFNRLEGALPEGLSSLAVWSPETLDYPVSGGSALLSSARAFVVEGNLLQGPVVPWYVFAGIPAAMAACRRDHCAVSVGLSGPGDGLFGCPDVPATPVEAGTLADVAAFRLACVDAGGVVRDLASVLRGDPVEWEDAALAYDTSVDPSAVAAAPPQSSSSSGLTTGALVGIVIGSLVGVALLASVVYLVGYRRYWAARMATSFHKMDPADGDAVTFVHRHPQSNSKLLAPGLPQSRVPIGAGSGYEYQEQAMRVLGRGQDAMV